MRRDHCYLRRRGVHTDLVPLGVGESTALHDGPYSVPGIPRQPRDLRSNSGQPVCDSGPLVG
jgi:hypothetical protein